MFSVHWFANGTNLSIDYLVIEMNICHRSHLNKIRVLFQSNKKSNIRLENQGNKSIDNAHQLWKDCSRKWIFMQLTNTTQIHLNKSKNSICIGCKTSNIERSDEKSTENKKWKQISMPQRNEQRKMLHFSTENSHLNRYYQLTYDPKTNFSSRKNYTNEYENKNETIHRRAVQLKIRREHLKEKNW